MLEKDIDLDRLFYPETIAVVGASSAGSGLMWGGNTYLEGSIKMNFRGKLYPVNPRAESILGIKAYSSISDIPEEIDLAVFSIPHTSALLVMKDCAKKRVKFVHLFTAGFSETGHAENIALEKEIISLARQNGMRLIGPNCMGIYCPEGGVAWTNELPSASGTIGFLSQSGQLAGHLILDGTLEGLSFNKVVSFGNASDLQAHEFLSYFAHDERIKLIGAYLEGLQDGDAFFETARKLTRKKPLVIWKGGQTEGGSRAAQSHTASIAGSPLVWEGLCRQAGIISVHSMEEMIFTLATLQKLSFVPGTNIAVLGGAGGGSVTMTDCAEREGLKVPKLSPATIAGLQEFVDLQGASVQNPLDIMPALIGPGRFKKLIDLLNKDDNIDALFFAQRMDLFYRVLGSSMIQAMIEMTIEATKMLKKPTFIIVETADSLEEEKLREMALEKYNAQGIPVFPSFAMASRVLFNMNQYYRYLDSLK
ncbi:MAG: CoA-binding protein [Deltaproteobacteria bacterium]|nr:CoA-binding protein [Deltaproteobacteria bacterium]